MKILRGLEALEAPFPRSVLTIGNFDGVHRAHQQLLAQAGLFAVNTGGPLVVLTFEPHPLTVVAPTRAPARLAPPDEKLRCLAKAGAEITVVAKSESALLSLEAERFVEEIIIARFRPTHIVEGPSFRFGRGRRGTPDLLRQVAAGFGCEVRIVDPVTFQVDAGETLMVSSSLIRNLLREGKVRQAALCLGRPYAMIGVVVSGDRRGRTIGFPTANLALAEQLVPGDGVYAGQALVHGDRFMAAISIGNTPTFGGTERRIEAHLLDFDGELLGESIRLELTYRLRDQRAFDSPQDLVRQLQRDVEAVRDCQTETRDESAS